MSRGDSWIQTYTGKQFWPLDPRSEEIDIIDVAGALSKLCRFGGHCLRFYSVAEHCVLMTSRAPREHKLATLLHDGSEAYLLDIPRPIKGDFTGYREIEERCQRIIFEHFGLDWPMPQVTKQLDEDILYDEFAQNMAPQVARPTSMGSGTALGVRLQFWDPDRAFSEFLRAFVDAGGAT